jgi:hypothetical protein
MGIGAFMALLNAMNARKEANRPTMSDEERQAIAQQGTDAMGRSLSATQGNPAGSGHAQQEMTNYAARMLARMKYEDEKDRRERQRRANEAMFGAGGMSLQALLSMLYGQGDASSGLLE